MLSIIPKPSYIPFGHPSVAIPTPIDTAAEIMRMIRVKSCKASQKNIQKPLEGFSTYRLRPYIFCLTGILLETTPSFSDTETSPANPAIPPCPSKPLLSWDLAKDAISSGSMPKPASLTSLDRLYLPRLPAVLYKIVHNLARNQKIKWKRCYYNEKQ